MHQEPRRRPVQIVPLQVPDPRESLEVLPRTEEPAKDSVGRGSEGDRKDKDRFKIRDVFADEQCSQAILGFLASIDVGRRISKVAGKDAASEVSVWNLREREERRAERSQEEEKEGAEA